MTDTKFDVKQLKRGDRISFKDLYGKWQPATFIQLDDHKGRMVVVVDVEGTYPQWAEPADIRPR